MFIAWAMRGLTYVTVAALCSSCSLQKYLERWPAPLYEAGRSVLMTGSEIPRIELYTFHLYQHYSLFMPNKLQYTWRWDYCECVRPAQLPVLTEVRAPSLLEKHPRYVPRRDRAGYDRNNCSLLWGTQGTHWSTVYTKCRFSLCYSRCSTWLPMGPIRPITDIFWIYFGNILTEVKFFFYFS